MSTSLASQLRAIKSATRGAEDPIGRPITRPSILFDPKEAADIDVRAIHALALSGLEVIIKLDSRFQRYRETLFNRTSIELEREKMVPKDEEKLNRSIRSYLLLLAGYLQLPASLKTLEYLIRRYRVHVFNVDELVLCALPYHDTHAFVRIIQLMDLGNGHWAFLEAVKTSGAPPPRKVIVQQCTVDKGVLEAICNYALATKDFQQPRQVTCFCTAVIVEALGCIPKVDSDAVNKTLKFVSNGLNKKNNPTRDHKAGALMIVGLLSTRAALESQLIQNFILSIARLAKEDAEDSSDLPWLRMLVMAIVSLVQAQSKRMLPKDTVISLTQIRDFHGLLFALSKEFNIHHFLYCYLESLVECSALDESCSNTLVKALETFPLMPFFEKIAFKVLASCMKLSQNTNKSGPHESEGWAKKIFSVFDAHYHFELCGAIRKFLEIHMKNSKAIDIDTFCNMLDGDLHISVELSDSRIWFLEHPKAEVRKATLCDITTDSLKSMSVNPQKLKNIQDAIVRRLRDDDLNVVQAALSIKDLSVVVAPHCLLDALRDLLTRCIDIINRRTSKTSKHTAIAISCIEHVVELNSHHLGYSEEVAIILFPLLVILPRTWMVNMKAMELVSQCKWALFRNCYSVYESISSEHLKVWKADYVASVNLKTINGLADTFVSKPQEHIDWLIKCGSSNSLSKTLFLLIILKTFMIYKKDSCSLCTIYEACFPVVKQEWLDIGIQSNFNLEKFNIGELGEAFTGLVVQVSNAVNEELNAKIVISIFWSLLKAYDEASKKMEDCATGAHQHPMGCDSDRIFGDMFFVFAKANSKHIFKEHLHFLVTSCGKDAFQFLSKYFVDEGYSDEVQVESLLSVMALRASSNWGISNDDNHLQLLNEFLALLVPLSNQNKGVRAAALDCVEVFYKNWRSFADYGLKIGDDTVLAHFISSPFFGDILASIVAQKKLIISDVNFLSSLITSLFTPSVGLLVPENLTKRYESSVKDEVLFFLLSSILKLHSPYGKFMALTLFRGVGSIILQADGMMSLFSELMERRNLFQNSTNHAPRNLSKVEIDTLCFFLEVCISEPRSGKVVDGVLDYVIKSLEVDDLTSKDEAVLRTVSVVIENLSPSFYSCLKIDQQNVLIGHLVSLSRNDNGGIRSAARKALLGLNVHSSSFANLLELLIDQDIHGKKKRKTRHLVGHQVFGLSRDSYNKDYARVLLIGSLLDTFSSHKSSDDRIVLVQPLFKVLEKIFSDDWVQSLNNVSESGNEDVNEVSEGILNAIYQAQQTIIIFLKGFFDSDFQVHPQKDDILSESNMDLLVNCIRAAKDHTTQNYLFMLLSSISRVSPLWISEHIVEVFTLVGEFATKQNDGHSQHVVEDLISALVPCWLSKVNNTDQLLQIFINSLPHVSEQRRLTLIICLLRTLGENYSLGLLVFNLFRSLIQRFLSSSSKHERNMNAFLASGSFIREWEYVFLLQIFDQYSCRIWFPCLVKVFEAIREPINKKERCALVYLLLRLIETKFQDFELSPEFNFQKDNDYLQATLGTLMEEIILHTCHIMKNYGKELKICSRGVLKSAISWMVPSKFFSSIHQLLDCEEISIKKETLGLLCEFVKDNIAVQNSNTKKKHKARKQNAFSFKNSSSLPSFQEMCLKIAQLVENCEIPVILDAISAIEILAKAVGSDNTVFMTCLASVMKHIGSDNSISARCLYSLSSLISVLGCKALPHLPYIMKSIQEKAHEVSDCPIGKTASDGSKQTEIPATPDVSVLLSILVALAAIIENLGGFLNPYLHDILDLVVLHPYCASEASEKLAVKASSLRKLLIEKIPARLMLSPLFELYDRAVKCGNFSLSLSFEMLSDLISTMDKSLIASYHSKIYKYCMSALKLRSQLPEAVKRIVVVEDSVIHAMIVLTMKLTESTFRPLFFHSLIWAEPDWKEGISSTGRGLDRVIPFYRLINRLIEHHRSLFVPYFKYLLDGFKLYLMEDQVVDSGSTQERKKLKTGDGKSRKKARAFLLPELWHVRALIIKSLYRCFLYDTSELKLLGLSDFEDLLKLIVSQFLVEPPSITNLPEDVPNEEDVDESLVLCLGQMAIASRSDVLWKSLNREVLMQTRNEKLRPKMLGLKVVSFLMKHLKEEYLFLMAETIPFLGERLEDAEHPVKTLAQEILKEMEELSGENLRQYL